MSFFAFRVFARSFLDIFLLPFSVHLYVCLLGKDGNRVGIYGFNFLSDSPLRASPSSFSEEGMPSSVGGAGSSCISNLLLGIGGLR